MHDLLISTALAMLAACTTALASFGTTMVMSKRAAKTAETAVKTSKETVQRQTIAIRRSQHIKAAGNYIPTNVQLLLEIFKTMDKLQLDKGELAKRLEHQKPVLIQTGDTAAEVIECRNICTLRSAVKAMCRDLLPFVAAIDPYLGLDDNKLHAYMFLNRSEAMAIVVRISDDRLDDEANNPITVNFFVQSYQAAQKVQGLLLLLGESCLNAPNDIVVWQGIMKERSKKSPDVQKPVVEIHLDNVHSWDPVPQAFVDTPLTTPKAWQTLANVFENLEIHPEAEYGPFISSDFKPASSPVFGTLRVHHGILLP